MKNKFERLSKKERKQAIKEYIDASDNNKTLYLKITRLKMIGIIGVIYSAIMFVFDFLKENDLFDYGFNVFNNVILNYLIDAILLIFCVIFIIKANLILKSQVNQYLINKKK